MRGADGTSGGWRMAEHAHPARVGAIPNAEHMSAVWWLVLPIVGALVLILWSKIAPQSYTGWMGGELGVLEGLQVVVPVASALLALRLLRTTLRRRHIPLSLWLGAAALGSVFIAGEEASWGQHYLQWTTPEQWQAINDQGETNLHNTSSWLDQKPRTLLEAGIVLGGILIPLAALRWPGIRRSRLAVILPPAICLPSAVLAEVAKAWERVRGVLDAQPFLFHRPSEIQETYFYVFILLYLIVLGRRLYAQEDAAAAPGRAR
jgi:hypothetical protein